MAITLLVMMSLIKLKVKCVFKYDEIMLASHFAAGVLGTAIAACCRAAYSWSARAYTTMFLSGAASPLTAAT